MKDILKQINDSGLTPNQYFALYCAINKLELNLNPDDLDREMKVLEDLGHIDGGVVTSRLFDDGDDMSFHMKVVRFMQIFPPIYLPGSTIHARGKLVPIKNKLKAYVKSFPHDWDVIYQATQNYVQRYADNGYAYMLCCSTYIFDKNGDSTLALECDTLEYNSKTEVAL